MDRARLEEERRVFEAERASVAQLEAQGSDRVVLDVGGAHFVTTRHTLSTVPGSMLAVWFSGRHAVKEQADGSVFIDRSPTPFGYVLDFLRSGGQVNQWPEDEEEEETLRRFDYYGLPWPKESVVGSFVGDLEYVDMDMEGYGYGGRRVRRHKMGWCAQGRALGISSGSRNSNDGHKDVAGILWDVKQGKIVSNWGPTGADEDERVQRVDFSGEYVCVTYDGRQNTQCSGGNPAWLCTRVAIYSAVDGILVRSFALEPPFPQPKDYGVGILGSQLVVVCPDNISLWNILSGARVWEVANSFEFEVQVAKVLKCHTGDEVFVCWSNDENNVLVVIDIATGEGLYEYSTCMQCVDCFPVARSLRLIDSGDGDEYYGWRLQATDAHGKGVVDRELRIYLDIEKFDNSDITLAKFYSADVIYICTHFDFTSCRLLFSTENRVSLAESRVIRGDYWGKVALSFC